jgi:hypothetical protein
MSGVWNLPEHTTKQLSLISNKIATQKGIITKAKAVLAEKGDTYVCHRARTSLAFNEAKLEKAKAEYEAYVKDLEAKIELQNRIIWEETNKKTPTIIMAETEIEILEKQKNDILKANNITTTPLTQSAQPPLTPPPQSRDIEMTDTIPSYESVSVDMSDFFREGRLDGQKIGPSYLDGPFRYHEKDIPGVGSLQRRPVRYGAVSQLEKSPA